MKGAVQSTSKLSCRRIEVKLFLIITLVLITSFYKYFNFVISIQNVVTVGGKMLAATKFNTLVTLTTTQSDKIIKIDDMPNIYDFPNTTISAETRRREIKMHLSEATSKAQHDHYIIRSENICSDVENLYALVLVHTAIPNFDRRKVIRNTWGNISLFQTHKIRIAFMLGKPEKTHHQMAIKLENEQYNDIVQGTFIDTYYNLTHKAILGLRWITENCGNAKYILKVDDDVVINTPRLIQLFSSKYKHVKRTIFCKVRRKGKIGRVGKWKVEKTQLETMTHWPGPYCPGHYVIYTADIIRDLYAAVRRTPFLWLDDVYVTGLLAFKVGNITHSNPDDIIQQVEWLENAKTNRLYETWKRISSRAIFSVT